MPVKTTPEPHFFLKDWEYEKGFGSYLQEWFSGVGAENAIGEKSSSYLYGGEVVARRIINAVPSVKLIVMLRDPVERAWANYRFTALNGLEPYSFEDAIRYESKRNSSAQGRWKTIKPFDYTGRSMYGKQIEAFLRVFPREQLLVLKSEDFRADSAGGFKKVFDFLGVENSFLPKKMPQFNSPNVISPEIQSQCRSVFGDRFGEVLRYVRARNSDCSSIVRNSCEEEALSRLKENITEEAHVIPDRLQAQLRRLFHDDVIKLSNIVDFSVDDWI